MTDDDLKAQLDRIEKQTKEAFEFLGCLKAVIVIGALLFIVISIFKSCGV